MTHEQRPPGSARPPARDASNAPTPTPIAMSASPPLDELHTAITDALRPLARAAQRAGAAYEPDEASLRTLDEVCALARRNGTRVEQLLIRLKEAWWRLPEFRDATRMDANVALSCVVTHCIREFYLPAERS